MSTQVPHRIITSPALRRRPKQVRGQRRVEQLLEVAERTFAEVGFEQTTTNMIAERAGVSIGSLYQFFSSKESILEAMAERYVLQMREMLEAQLPELTAANYRQRIDTLLKLIIKHQDDRPYFLQCLAANRLSPVLERIVEDMHGVMTEHVAQVFVRLGADAGAPILHLRSRMAVEAISSLIPMAVRAKGHERQLILREIRAFICAYIDMVVMKEAAA